MDDLFPPLGETDASGVISLEADGRLLLEPTAFTYRVSRSDIVKSRFMVYCGKSLSECVISYVSKELDNRRRSLSKPSRSEYEELIALRMKSNDIDNDMFFAPVGLKDELAPKFIDLGYIGDIAGPGEIPIIVTTAAPSLRYQQMLARRQILSLIISSCQWSFTGARLSLSIIEDDLLKKLMYAFNQRSDNLARRWNKAPDPIAGLFPENYSPSGCLISSRDVSFSSGLTGFRTWAKSLPYGYVLVDLDEVIELVRADISSLMLQAQSEVADLLFFVKRLCPCPMLSPDTVLVRGCFHRPIFEAAERPSTITPSTFRTPPDPSVLRDLVRAINETTMNVFNDVSSENVHRFSLREVSNDPVLTDQYQGYIIYDVVRGLCDEYGLFLDAELSREDVVSLNCDPGNAYEDIRAMVDRLCVISLRLNSFGLE